MPAYHDNNLPKHIAGYRMIAKKPFLYMSAYGKNLLNAKTLIAIPLHYGKPVRKLKL